MEAAVGFSFLDSVAVSWPSICQALWALLPIWAFGALVGLLLPRPKWIETGTKGAFLMSTPPGSLLRRLALAYHALLMVREIWYHFTCPGTFRRLVQAILRWCSGKGWYFQWPAGIEQGQMETALQGQTSQTGDEWYVGEKDLAFFKYHAVDDGPCEGASKWELMMEKDIPNVVKYTAWRRTLPSGKTEYKSITISPDATPEEFIDLYFDDNFRSNWDGMVIEHEVLEDGDFAQRQQVVRWVRSFPFQFLSNREYVIARQLYREPDGMYGLTKAIDRHPREPSNSSYVRMDVFWSMWRSRATTCPWDSGKPACETILLHHEQFKIPENLARFAVRHGMWGFVKHLSRATPQYVALRREHCDMDQADPAAYGFDGTPNPPSKTALPSSMSCSSIASLSSDCSDMSSDSTASRTQGRRMRALAAVAVAGGFALVLGGKGSSVDGSLRRREAQRRRRGRRQSLLQADWCE